MWPVQAQQEGVPKEWHVHYTIREFTLKNDNLDQRIRTMNEHWKQKDKRKTGLLSVMLLILICQVHQQNMGIFKLAYHSPIN